MRCSAVYCSRIARRSIVACVAAAGVTGAVMAQAPSPATESVFVRAQRMVTAGQDSAGRAVVSDSHNPYDRIWELLRAPAASRAGVTVESR